MRLARVRGGGLEALRACARTTRQGAECPRDVRRGPARVCGSRSDGKTNLDESGFRRRLFRGRGWSLQARAHQPQLLAARPQDARGALATRAVNLPASMEATHRLHPKTACRLARPERDLLCR